MCWRPCQTLWRLQKLRPQWPWLPPGAPGVQSLNCLYQEASWEPEPRIRVRREMTEKLGEVSMENVDFKLGFWDWMGDWWVSRKGDQGWENSGSWADSDGLHDGEFRMGLCVYTPSQMCMRELKRIKHSISNTVQRNLGCILHIQEVDMVNQFLGPVTGATKILKLHPDHVI